MIENQIILTICLPTYNRENFIKNQIDFFESEVKIEPSILTNVRFIVGNNASTDNTTEVLAQLNKKNPFFEVIHNNENLGLVGNIINLLNHSYSEYVWFVSDDDILSKGILVEILNILKNHNQLEFVFLNFLLNNKKAFTGKVGYRTDGKEAAMEIYRERYGALVFMTSCVYKRNNLLEIANSPMFGWLSGPLFYSLYSCSKNNIFITNKEWVSFTPNNGSYDSLGIVLKLKFEEYIPILEGIVDFGYSKHDVKRTIQNFFKKQSHAHFLYNFINLKKSIQYYKYYTVKTMIFSPLNLFSYRK